MALVGKFCTSIGERVLKSCKYIFSSSEGEELISGPTSKTAFKKCSILNTMLTRRLNFLHISACSVHRSTSDSVFPNTLPTNCSRTTDWLDLGSRLTTDINSNNSRACFESLEPKDFSAG